MPYFLIDNFNGGMDTRRNTAAPAGSTMREIRNGFVNRGGEIERRRSFVMNETVTLGFRGTSDSHMVFGPYPLWDRLAVGYVVHTVPSTSGTDWVADTSGAGVVLPDGDIFHQFFGYTSIGVDRDLPRIDATSFYPDRAIVTFTYRFDATGSLSTSTLDLTIPITNYGPSATAVVIGQKIFPRGPTTMLGGHISRFGTLFGVGPNSFNLLKHATLDPTSVGGTGSGSVDIRSNGERVGSPRSIREYYSQVALFCDYGVQFWNIDSDPAAWSYDRSIAGEGLIGIRTPIAFQGGDILYLTATGVRSLRARDSSNFAISTDIGSPIDGEIKAALANTPLAGDVATSVTHIAEGHIWLFLADEVFVLSPYRGEGISAWSIYDLPAKNETYHKDRHEFTGYDANRWVLDASPVSSTVCMRTAGNVVYTYGDPEEAGGTHYASDYTTTVITHYFGVQDPFTDKVFNSVDVTASGTWTIEYSLDPENETWTEIYSGAELTHGLADIKIDQTAQLIALRLTTTDASAATLSQIAIHYDKTEDQG